MRVVRVAPAGPGPRRASTRWCPRALARAAAAARRATTCWSCAARACSACPALRGRARGWASAVVLQAEVNGEMSGEVYTWGTAPRPRAPAARDRARRGRARATCCCATPTPSWPCRARIRDELLDAGRARGEGRATSRTASTPSASGRRPPDERAALRARLGLPADGARRRLHGPAAARQGAGDAARRVRAARPRAPRAHLAARRLRGGPGALRRGRRCARAWRAAAWPAA